MLEVLNWRNGSQTTMVENWIDNISVSLQNPTFITSEVEIPASTGGNASLTVNVGSTYVGKEYVIFSGVTGTYPGVNIGGVDVPLNFDSWTWIAFSLLNSPIMSNFHGVLDANGMGVATFLFPLPEPSAAGLAMYFNAWVLAHPSAIPILKTTNSVYILFTP